MARFAQSVTGLMTISYAPHAVPDGVGVVLVTFAATVHTKGHTSSVKVATKIKNVIRIIKIFIFLFWYELFCFSHLLCLLKFLNLFHVIF